MGIGRADSFFFRRVGALVKEICKHMYYMYTGYLNIPMSFKIIYLCGCVYYTSCGIVFHIRKALGVRFEEHAKGRKRTSVST